MGSLRSGPFSGPMPAVSAGGETGFAETGGMDDGISAGGVGGEGLCSTWAAMSSFVTRPPRPLPLIDSTSVAPSFAAAAALRAAGIIGRGGALAGGAGIGLG